MGLGQPGVEPPVQERDWDCSSSGVNLPGTAQGLTKTAIADVLVVSPVVVGQYETGVTRLRPELIPPLAELLEVPLAFFPVGRPHAHLVSTIR